MTLARWNPCGLSWQRLALMLPVMAGLSGCSVLQQAADLAGRSVDRQAQLHVAQAEFADSLTDRQRRWRAQEVDRPWLAGRPEPLAREVVLPVALRGDVRTALMFPDNDVHIDDLAARITRATGIAVRVDPEVRLPDAAFGRRSGSGVTAGSDQPRFQIPDDVLPLPKVLDLAAARLAIDWRYRDGELHFFRTESRVFNVRALMLQSRAQAGLGRTDGGAAGAFAVASNTQIEAQIDDVMTAVTMRLEPLLTRAGQVAAHQDGSSLVVVTDTPAALARVAAFLERENRALTRRVRLLFEEVTVALDEGGEAGIDWNLLYSASRVGAALALPGAGADALAGSLQATVEGGPWQGSSAIVQALDHVGSVTRHVSIPLVTLNRRPVTHAVRTTFSWIDKVQTTAVAAATDGGVAASLPSVSVSQKEETVGQFLTLIPDAQEDGQILLSIAYDTTVAQPLTSVTFGRGDNAVEVQQLTVDGNGTVQQVELRPGQPMIVSGFDRDIGESDSRRLDRKLPAWLGGADRSRQRRETTLVIVTAAVEEGF